jgi:hypothetical protein
MRHIPAIIFLIVVLSSSAYVFLPWENKLIADKGVASKALQAATVTFKDTYGYLPGDLPNPEDHIKACKTEFQCGSGNGDGRIGSGDLIQDILTEEQGNETLYFWQQLKASGISPAIRTYLFYKNDYSYVGFYDGNTPLPFQYEGTKVKPGHYLFVTKKVETAVTEETLAAYAPGRAFRLDSKLDDAIPEKGKTIALGSQRCIKPALSGESKWYYNEEYKKPCMSLLIWLHD